MRVGWRSSATNIAFAFFFFVFQENRFRLFRRNVCGFIWPMTNNRRAFWSNTFSRGNWTFHRHRPLPRRSFIRSVDAEFSSDREKLVSNVDLVETFASEQKRKSDAFALSSTIECENFDSARVFCCSILLPSPLLCFVRKRKSSFSNFSRKAERLSNFKRMPTTMRPSRIPRSFIGIPTRFQRSVSIVYVTSRCSFVYRNLFFNRIIRVC